MDPHLRDEIETNDLETFLSNLKTWWAKWGNYILIAVLLVAAGIFIKNTIQRRQYEAHEEAWNTLATATSPEVLEKAGANYKDANFKAQTLLKAGDLNLAKARTALGDPKEAEARDKALLEARRLYSAVADDASKPWIYRLNARLGLASVAEEQAKWDDAQAIYKQVQADAGDRFPHLRDQAMAKAQLLPRISAGLNFGPEPVEGPAVPATNPKPATTAPGLTMPLELSVPTTAPATR